MPADSLGHKLDIYLPENPTDAMPLIVWTGGSAWRGDNGKERIGTLPTVFNEAGYIVAGVSVRSSFQAIYPAQFHDHKAAIRWLRANAEQYHIDPDNIGVFGTSSAGWGSAMAAVTSNVPELEGDIGVAGPSSAVQAAIAFFPPTDFSLMDLWSPSACEQGQGFCHDGPTSPESQLVGCQITTCPEQVQLANPVNYADREDPPLMILHGLSDTTVPAHQGQLLYQTLSKACAEVAFIAQPMAGHSNNEGMVTDPALQGGSYMLSTSSEDCTVTTP
jgi:acetyl esterase/lipase